MQTIKLFTTTNCPKCPAAKKYLADNKIEYEPIIVDKQTNGMELAQHYNISSVPTIVIDETPMTLDEIKAFHTALNSHPKLMKAIGEL